MSIADAAPVSATEREVGRLGKLQRDGRHADALEAAQSVWRLQAPPVSGHRAADCSSCQAPTDRHDLRGICDICFGEASGPVRRL